VYRTLRADRIIDTARQLEARIVERFPESSLGKVAAELTSVAKEAGERCEAIQQSYLSLRIGGALVGALGLGGLIALATRVEVTPSMWQIENFLEEFDAAIGSVVFLGAAFVFLVTLETRFKRRKALEAIGELRAIAHIVDMHQLTKDPEPIIVEAHATPSSPKRAMTPFELSRYLDYCSELLSITSKIGALYVQAFPDPVALAAVDEVENLCSGLSRKVWQKIMILDRFAGAAREDPQREPA
jgi:hypothetical protein